ncbi:MAG: carboxylating nicotinate-nucleotide diphosphorylase [Acidobacteriota bacterium]
MSESLDPATYRELVRRALAEDVATGDVTTEAIVPHDRPGLGVLVAKAPIVLAGLDVARHVFLEVDPDISFQALRNDGDPCENGARLAEVRGRAASLLVAERTALNLLQGLSGIATLTRSYVAAAAGRIRVIDTRKTAPMQRALAKYAVRCGGGFNHRTGLFDGVLIKDNHIRVAGSVAEAVRRVRATTAGAMPVEVETQTLAQVDEAVAAGADVVMLDNMDDSTTAVAIARIAGRARVELSGTMTLERVRRLASSGADDVSVGALTHSAPAADISFEIDL